MKKVVFDIIRHFLKKSKLNILDINVVWDEDCYEYIINVVFDKSIKGRHLKTLFENMEKRIAKYDYFVSWSY